MGGETKTCKYCQTEIPKKAKICPNCKKKQGPKVWLIVLIVIVVVGIMGTALGGSDSSSSNSSSSTSSTTTTTNEDTKQEVKEEASIEYTAVTVTELEDAIQGNALQASDTYKGQYLEISGCLNVIDASGTYISVNAGSDDWSLVNVQCYMKNDDQKAVIMGMNKGDKIVVKGKCKDVGEVLGYQIDIDEIIAQ